MNRAILVRTDGTMQDIGHKPELEEAYRLIGNGCDIVEVVRPRGRFGGKLVQFICDEEAYLRPTLAPRNRVATLLYQGVDLNEDGTAERAFQPRITDHEVLGNVIVLFGWRFA